MHIGFSKAVKLTNKYSRDSLAHFRCVILIASWLIYKARWYVGRSPKWKKTLLDVHRRWSRELARRMPAKVAKKLNRAHVCGQRCHGGNGTRYGSMHEIHFVQSTGSTWPPSCCCSREFPTLILQSDANFPLTFEPFETRQLLLTRIIS